MGGKSGRMERKERKKDGGRRQAGERTGTVGPRWMRSETDDGRSAARRDQNLTGSLTTWLYPPTRHPKNCDLSLINSPGLFWLKGRYRAARTTPCTRPLPPASDLSPQK